MGEIKNNHGASSAEDRALAEGEAAVPSSSSLRDCDPSREARIDLLSHSAAWRSAIMEMHSSSPDATEDTDEKAYWQHELTVFDRVVDALQSVGEPGGMSWMPQAKDVAEAMQDGGWWRSCSGCHETNEGYETGHYPYSPVYGCYVGAGCSECGGIGVTWEPPFDEVAFQRAMQSSAQAMEARQGGDAEGGSVGDDSAVTEGDVPQADPSSEIERLIKARDVAEHQRNCLFEFLHGAGVRLGVINPNVACTAPQLMTAMEAYFDHLQSTPSPQGGTVGRDPEGWQPIETAPTDGTWIETCRVGEPDPSFCGLLRHGYAEPPETAWWCIHGDRWTAAQRPHDPWRPTHWRPLPPAPRPSHEGMSDALQPQGGSDVL